MATDPFFVVEAAEPGPVVVEIPHAGLFIDEATSRHARIPPAALEAGAVLSDSDIGADLLWQGAESRGVTRVVAVTSRYVIDLNTEPRVPTRYEETMPAPMRAVLKRSQCGHRWREPGASKAEIERRIREVFEPYHGRVAEELARARARHGVAVLISAHTFPDVVGSADVVLGTRHGQSATGALRDAIADVVREHGLTVALEAPFPGGFAVLRHGRPDEGVSVVQIEVARRLLCTDGVAPYRVDPVAVERVRKMSLDVADRVRGIALLGLA
jgi:N-formylglutamate deformylase